MNARAFPALRTLLTLLALVAQLAAGASVPPLPVMASVDGVPICHGGEEPVDAPAPHRPADCVLCPACVAIGTPSALLLPTSPTPPSARAGVIARAAPPPPATAPPSPHRIAAQPRAPPSQA